MAAEPSTIELEFPAVTTPSALKAGCSEASFSSDVSRRGVSSTAKRTTAPPAPTSTGMISFSNLPSSLAATARRWDSSEYSSSASRLRPHSSAMTSAEIPCGTIGQRSPIFSLTAPQPDVAEVRAHRHAGHVLDACRDDDVEVARLYRGCRIERRLQRGAALPVDGGCTDGLGPARDEDGAPPDVQRLLADLRDAAHLHVLDLARIEVDAADESVQNLCGELVGANLGKRSVPPPDRGADGVDDVGGRPSRREHRTSVQARADLRIYTHARGDDRGRAEAPHRG